MLDFATPLEGIRSPFGRRQGGAAFSPSTLFALAEPGVWFDPSDLTTLFQDPAGTTPVTAPGNTVGLMLDKSKALALGAELVTNGDFSGGATGWLFEAGWAIASGVATGTATGGFLYQNTGSITQGKYYDFTFTVTGYAGGSIQPFVGSSPVFGTAASSSGTFTRRIFLSASSGQLGLKGTSFTGSIDNISVRELAGNHATQATLTARPTYSVEPVGGRRNLLLQTEAFSNAAWISRAGATVQADTTEAPDGTLTADTITFTASDNDGFYQSLSNGSSGTTTVSVWAKVASGTRKFRLMVYSGVLGVNMSGEFTATTTWQRFSYTSTFLHSSGVQQVNVMNMVTSPTSGNLIVWGAQLELGSTATAYQRVTTQHDVTEAGVASVGYLYFDGTDDSMTTTVDTNTIFGVAGTDPGYLLVGGAKYNTAGGAILAYGRAAFCGDNAGYFGMWAHTVNGGEAGIYQWDTTVRTAERPYVVGSAAVFTGRRNPSEGAAGKIYASVNGVSSAGTDGAALNGASGPLLVGKQLGNTFLNGNIYSLIARGALTDAPTIASTETWVAGKTGIDIAKNISTTIYTRSGDTILDRANSTIERRAV